MSSSEDESEHDGGEDGNLIKSLLKAYSEDTAKGGGDTVISENLDKFQEFLREGYLDRSQSCLCIQRWVKEGVHQLVRQSNTDTNEDSLARVSSWGCPKCRKEYAVQDCPRHYYCFCGETRDPKPDPWLVPHSCGQVCGKALGCEHTCLLLCHPGACPACPKVVHSKCHCGRQGPLARRCGNRGWSCQKACGRRLACKAHSCIWPCHAGECFSCTAESMQPCLCGKKQQTRLCAEPRWQCGQLCRRPLVCGRHFCQETCHGGLCQPCVPEGERTCPCGKTMFEEIICVDDQPVCGDTCGKLLACGYHYCIERCHKGACPECKETRQKRCRCGAKEKPVPCGKEFTCDIKCRRKKDCGRHTCNKKCCDGRSCPPCEQVCGRSLQCANHKCSSPCHNGMCYPCTLTVDVKCFCRGTVFRVPCGKERKTKPPRCRKPCAIPPDCHHKTRDPHHCHFERCPPCQQICGKMYSCKHTCPQTCHTAVLMDTNLPKQKPIGPWDKPEPKLELVAKLCAPCMVLVPVNCIGGHETGQFPCSEARSYSCGRPCGKSLLCGNHTCAQLCHSRTTPCDDCNNMCDLARPAGCTHTCPKRCHSAPCPPCRQLVRQDCHCGINQRYIPCCDWVKASQEERINYLCCEDKCPKQMDCGHRCAKICHTGPCTDVSECPKKTAVYCECRRRKQTTPCKKAKNYVVSCDEECEKLKQEEEKKFMEENRRKMEAEEKAKAEELERMERRFGNAKGKKNRRKESTETSHDKSSKWLYISAAGGALFIALMTYLMIVNSGS